MRVRLLSNALPIVGLPVFCLVVLSSSCVGDSSADNSGQLVPADQAVGEQINDYEFGTTADLGGGISIRVSNPTVQRDQYSTSIRVETRAENRGKNSEALHPSVGIVCRGSLDKGDTISESNMSILDPLPPNSFLEGALLLYRPGDEREGSGVAECEAPAVIRVEQQGSIEPGSKSADFPIPEELLAEING